MPIADAARRLCAQIIPDRARSPFQGAEDAPDGRTPEGVYVIDIAVGNIAIEEIWNTVEDGTPIEIRP
jgi:hypothetical protein